ncbi:MAG: NAD(P)/FAD-dependent oxidoreductase [Pseudomonadota bacterium]
MTETTDVAVVGAGVVGIAVARASARAGRETVLFERNDRIGAETSSRNSEVIHAGVYYRPTSLKARLCVLGKALLYDYLERRGVPHRRCGKYVVAAHADEIPKLQAIKDNAVACGVDDLKLVDGDEARAAEPALACAAALTSPSSGVVDSHALMTSLLGDFDEAGGVLALRAPVDGGALRDDGARLRIGGADPYTVRARVIVNAAGLWADGVARALEGLDPASAPRVRPAVGRYFSYSGPAPFSRLVYPLPAAGGLGVHYTIDLAGAARFGPDIAWDAALGDYRVDPALRDAFAAAVRRYWPDVDADRLQPAYAGQRAKLGGPDVETDFMIARAPGYIGLYGIESPGLTASLAIAEAVAQML